MLSTIFVAAALGAVVVSAAALPSTNASSAAGTAVHASISNTDTSAALSQALLAIAPTSNSCAGASYPSECRTASQAAPFIDESFTTYKISSPNAQAALIALMAYESGDFKYATNKFPAPGVLGKGCRNMQSPHFNALYAAQKGVSIAEVQTQDMTSFGAAAWFVATQCLPGVLSELNEAGSGWTQVAEQAWNAYMGCVGATDGASARLQYFRNAVQAWAAWSRRGGSGLGVQAAVWERRNGVASWSCQVQANE